MDSKLDYFSNYFSTLSNNALHVPLLSHLTGAPCCHHRSHALLLLRNCEWKRDATETPSRGILLSCPVPLHKKTQFRIRAVPSTNPDGEDAQSWAPPTPAKGVRLVATDTARLWGSEAVCNCGFSCIPLGRGDYKTWANVTNNFWENIVSHRCHISDSGCTMLLHHLRSAFNFLQVFLQIFTTSFPL